MCQASRGQNRMHDAQCGSRFDFVEMAYALAISVVCLNPKGQLHPEERLHPE